IVTVAGGKVGAAITIAKTVGGPNLNTPVLAVDGAQYVVAWGEGKGAVFDDRVKIARVERTGKLVAGYPRRIDPEEGHQGYASLGGSGCDLAVSYILGDPNGEVRVGVVRAP